MKSTIAIIGAGHVGSTTAYALLLKNLVAQIILVDIDKTRCKGELLDLEDALAFVYSSSIVMGTYEDARQADIIIITAGHPQKPGQTRRELLQSNKKIIKSIIDNLKPLQPETLIIMVTNPLDILTYYAQQLTSIPQNQLFGTGTFLDTQRLRTLLTRKLGIAEQSINAFMLGEHGDSQFATWSTASAGGTYLTSFGLTEKDKTTIVKEVRNQAYEIIQCKGATFYGIAACVASICESLIFDQKRVIPLSIYVEQFNVCLSLPVVVGGKGVEKIIFPSLDKKEKTYLDKAAQVIQEGLQELR